MAAGVQPQRYERFCWLFRHSWTIRIPKALVLGTGKACTAFTCPTEKSGSGAPALNRASILQTEHRRHRARILTYMLVMVILIYFFSPLSIKEIRPPSPPGHLIYSAVYIILLWKTNPFRFALFLSLMIVAELLLQEPTQTRSRNILPSPALCVPEALCAPDHPSSGQHSR